MSNGNLGINKDLEPLARRCRKAGWDVGVTKGNHVRWVAPDGEVFITSLTGRSTSARIYGRKIQRHLEAAR